MTSYSFCRFVRHFCYSPSPAHSTLHASHICGMRVHYLCALIVRPALRQAIRQSSACTYKKTSWYQPYLLSPSLAAAYGYWTGRRRSLRPHYKRCLGNRGTSWTATFPLREQIANLRAMRLTLQPSLLRLHTGSGNVLSLAKQLIRIANARKVRKQKPSCYTTLAVLLVLRRLIY
jgi:hypothetical protein